MFFQVKLCVILAIFFDISPQMCYIIQVSWFHNDNFIRRFQSFLCRSGEIGRRTGFKIQRTLGPCRFESDLRHTAMVS